MGAKSTGAVRDPRNANYSTCSDGSSDGIVAVDVCSELLSDMYEVALGSGNSGGRPRPSVAWSSTAAAVYPTVAGTRERPARVLRKL